jgi:hypothetical protein
MIMHKWIKKFAADYTFFTFEVLVEATDMKINIIDHSCILKEQVVIFCKIGLLTFYLKLKLILS